MQLWVNAINIRQSLVFWEWDLRYDRPTTSWNVNFWPEYNLRFRCTTLPHRFRRKLVHRLKLLQKKNQPVGRQSWLPNGKKVTKKHWRKLYVTVQVAAKMSQKYASTLTKCIETSSQSTESCWCHFFQLKTPAVQFHSVLIAFWGCWISGVTIKVSLDTSSWRSEIKNQMKSSHPRYGSCLKMIFALICRIVGWILPFNSRIPRSRNQSVQTKFQLRHVREEWSLSWHCKSGNSA